MGKRGLARKVRMGALLALTLAIAPAGPAHAAALLFTYSGEVASGTDGLGVFGDAGADLAGQGFTVTYTLEGALMPNARLASMSSGRLAQSAPAIRALVTINGRDFLLRGDHFGMVSHRDDFLFSEEGDGEVLDSVYHLAYGADRGTRVVSQIGDLTARMLSSPSIAARTLYTVRADDIAHSRFETAGLVGERSLATALDLTPRTFAANLRPFAPAVPEPASWLMLLAGFAGVGAALRRARRKRQIPALA